MKFSKGEVNHESQMIKIYFSKDEAEHEKQIQKVLDVLVFNGVAVYFYNEYCLVEDTPRARANITKEVLYGNRIEE